VSNDEGHNLQGSFKAPQGNRTARVQTQAELKEAYEAQERAIASRHGDVTYRCLHCPDWEGHTAKEQDRHIRDVHEIEARTRLPRSKNTAVIEAKKAAAAEKRATRVAVAREAKRLGQSSPVSTR